MKMSNELYTYIKDLERQVHQLKRANSRLKGEVRKFRRIVSKMKKEKEKQHYKNGRRGHKIGR